MRIVKAARVMVLVLGCAAPALFVAMLLYVKAYTEGWGALAFGALFFWVFVANTVVVALGTLLYLANVRRRPRDLSLGLVVGLNLFVLWYFGTHR